MNKKILLIEDEEILRSLLSQRLREEGFKVEEATDGETGLKKLNEEKVDLVLLDLILPGMDGYEFLLNMKKDSKFSSIPVIVLSNLGQDDEIKKALDSGAKDYLIKSNFGLEEITQRIKNIFSS